MPYKVLISSTRSDLELARDLANRLEEAGISVFPAEKTVVPENRIVTTVHRALREADEVVIMLTKDSCRSPGLLSTIGIAAALGKRLAPIVVNLDARDAVAMLREIHPIPYADLSTYISELATRTNQHRER